MTKIKISKDGYLHIMRGSVLKSVDCFRYEMAHCGDWCARFVEPEEWDIDRLYISVCGSCHFCSKDDFVDERE